MASRQQFSQIYFSNILTHSWLNPWMQNLQIEGRLYIIFKLPTRKIIVSIYILNSVRLAEDEINYINLT